MFEVKKNYESMDFIRDRYDEEFEMWDDISAFIQTLMKNDKVCSIHDEGVVVVVEYGHDERRDHYGGPALCWLEEDEQELLYNYREEKYQNSHREED